MSLHEPAASSIASDAAATIATLFRLRFIPLLPSDYEVRTMCGVMKINNS